MQVAVLDLFKIRNDGEPVWLGPVESIEEGRMKAKLQYASDPNCDFCVLDQNTGKIVDFPRKELG